MITSYYPSAPARPSSFHAAGRHLHVVGPLADGRDDLLATLADLAEAGVRVQVVAPVTYLDPCGTCPEDPAITGGPAEAVAAVQTTTRAGRTYITPVCAEHIESETTWMARLGHQVTVLVPNGEVA